MVAPNRGPRHLARLQGQIRTGALPRPAGALVSGGVEIAIFVAYFIVAIILSIVTFGIAAVILFPLMAILPFAPLAHGCYAAYKVSRGEDYRYPFVADRIDAGTRRIA
jgi:hypothetical protein